MLHFTFQNMRAFLWPLAAWIREKNISQADFEELISGISVFVEKKLRKEFCKFSRTCRYVAIFCESTLAIHSDPCYFSFPVQRFYPWKYIFSINWSPEPNSFPRYSFWSYTRLNVFHLLQVYTSTETVWHGNNSQWIFFGWKIPNTWDKYLQ